MTNAHAITKKQYEYLLPVPNIKGKMLRRFTGDAISYCFVGKRAEYIDFLNRCKFHEPATLATPDPECCEHCNLFDVFSKGLCQGCFEDQYSDGARW